MIYVHSFSDIEQQISKLLTPKCTHHQIDIRCVNGKDYFERIQGFEQHDTLLYSFQQLDFYSHLNSFQNEIKQLKLLIDFVKKFNYKKLILISYPGAYPSSDNLFLQHKGFIEQMFVNTQIPCTILKVQGISNPPMQMHNLHHLFYHHQPHQYVIPREGKNIVYSINIANLVEVINKSTKILATEHYDIFDKISNLESFLKANSSQINIRRVPCLYLYFLSFLHKYISPTMFELFVRSNVPMYNFRAEKAFGISLHAEMFEQLKSPENRNKENNFIFLQKGQLIPVS